MPTVQIIYATGSGHTEYVVNVLAAHLRENAAHVSVTLTRAEQATPDDMTKSDVVILASGSWNTGGVEGQMHPFMVEFLGKRAKDVELKKKRCTVIALGDERYYYTARAGEHMRMFLIDHGADMFMDPLTVVNDPYGQEEKVRKWCDRFVSLLLKKS
ncbi:flavodoxin domain-containing protein [Candidatus Peregrinibacteria bacterium]|nr:flavodoxin domain-containing protein [Candidatus Peregrinibacteria bacterium]